MSIGPSIPAHLLRRKLEDSEERIGSGPQLPNGDLVINPIPSSHIPVQEQEDDEDPWAPSLPPDLTAAPRVLGPTLPPSHDPQSDGISDSDDDYGPKPLSSSVKVDERGEGVREFIEREERRKKELEESLKPKQLKRDEWMLVPPKSSDLLGSLDPTKLKSRQFSRTTEDKPTASTLWTETPAERQARLADEIMGKRKRSEIAAGGRQAEEETAEDRKRRKRDVEIKKHVEEHNKSKRAASLVELHAPSLASKPGSSISTGSTSRELQQNSLAIWDRDRDMSLGGRLMDDAARTKMIKDAKSLGDRFGSGKGGRYM